MTGKQLADWLSHNPQLVSVAFPLAVAVFGVSSEVSQRGVRYVASFLPAWLACTIGSYFCSFWTRSGDLVQLHILQVQYIWIAVCAYRGTRIGPVFGFALTFFSIACVDISQVYWHAAAVCGETGFCADGIGGAGVFDALFVFPIASALTTAYAAWRRGEASYKPDRIISRLGSCIANVDRLIKPCSEIYSVHFEAQTRYAI